MPDMSDSISWMSDRGPLLNSIKCSAENPKCPAQLFFLIITGCALEGSGCWAAIFCFFFAAQHLESSWVLPTSLIHQSKIVEDLTILSLSRSIGPMVQHIASEVPTPYVHHCLINLYIKQRWMYGDGIPKALCWTMGPKHFIERKLKKSVGQLR